MEKLKKIGWMIQKILKRKLRGERNMAIFKKNPNEVFFHEGKKHWADVIKNTGSGELLVWKQPEEDFNTKSTLIVNPGEEAIFVHKGVIEKPFTSGTYKLSTENYPFISRLINMKAGGISAFNCKVYFFRTAHSMEIYWGTDSPIQVRDSVLGLMTSIQARGAYKVQIEDCGLLLSKLLGNNMNVLTQESLYDYFASEFQQHIRSNIAGYVRDSGKEVLGICAEQDVLADKIGNALKEIVKNYGLKLVSFSVMAIDIPKNDPNRELLEKAFAEKARLNILGNDWEKVMSKDMLSEVIKNQKGSNLQSVAGEIGIGLAAAGAINNMAKQFIKPIESEDSSTHLNHPGQFVQQQVAPLQNTKTVSSFCVNCGQPVDSSMKFCSQCGHPVPQQQKMFCSQCGSSLNEEDRFCKNCGNPVKGR